jgi:3-phosphoshikimate 1-carboxyvinyltransferase
MIFFLKLNVRVGLVTFEFAGSVDSSKSLVNRALIVQSYQPGLELSYQAESNDVRVLKKALEDFAQGKNSFFCADAGTAFRFLVVRLSREPGTWVVSGTPRLLARPQKGLLQLLQQWNVDVECRPDQWKLVSNGWKATKQLQIDAEESSQFASAALLNLWGLPDQVELRISENPVSEGYLKMTVQLLRDLGMNMEEVGPNISISANQIIKKTFYAIEADLSSCFALAACAVQNGQVCIENFPWNSLQPDRVFVDRLQEMGVSFSRNEESLIVQKTTNLKPLIADLKGTPDLFPVLAVLCARAKGMSRLTGLSHLPAKESNRLQNTMNLLHSLGRKTELKNFELTIWGEEAPFVATGDFDPDLDHRMAMAAQVANLYGSQFKIKNRSVVDKSFPQFWKILGEE